MTGTTRKLTGAAESYFNDLRQVRASGGGTSERSYYPALANLLAAVGGTLKPTVFCVHEGADPPTGHPSVSVRGAEHPVEHWRFAPIVLRTTLRVIRIPFGTSHISHEIRQNQILHRQSVPAPYRQQFQPGRRPCACCRPRSRDWIRCRGPRPPPFPGKPEPVQGEREPDAFVQFVKTRSTAVAGRHKDKFERIAETVPRYGGLTSRTITETFR